jgi:hypothetical protein
VVHIVFNNRNNITQKQNIVSAYRYVFRGRLAGLLCEKQSTNYVNCVLLLTQNSVFMVFCGLVSDFSLFVKKRG